MLSNSSLLPLSLESASGGSDQDHDEVAPIERSLSTEFHFEGPAISSSSPSKRHHHLSPLRIGSFAGCSADTSGIGLVKGGLNGSVGGDAGSAEILASTEPVLGGGERRRSSKVNFQQELIALRNDLLDTLSLVERLMEDHREEVSSGSFFRCLLLLLLLIDIISGD